MRGNNKTFWAKVLSVGLTLVSGIAGWRLYDQLWGQSIAYLVAALQECCRLTFLFALVYTSGTKRMVSWTVYVVLAFFCAGIAVFSLVDEIGRVQVARDLLVQRHVADMAKRHHALYQKERVGYLERLEQVRQNVDRFGNRARTMKKRVERYEQELKAFERKFKDQIALSESEPERYLTEVAAPLIGSESIKRIEKIQIAFGVESDLFRQVVAVLVVIFIELNIIVLTFFFRGDTTVPLAKKSGVKPEVVTFKNGEDAVIPEDLVCLLYRQYSKKEVDRYISRAGRFLRAGCYPPRNTLSAVQRRIQEELVKTNLKRTFKEGV
jgi:hypothetical protein